MPSLGGWEWVILAVVALVLFGGAKLAGLGKGAGRAIREFKEETSKGRAHAELTEARPSPGVDAQSADAEKTQPHEA